MVRRADAVKLIALGAVICLVLLPVSSLNLVHCGGEKRILLSECFFCHGSYGFNFTCTSCIIYYQATQRVEVFHVLQL